MAKENKSAETKESTKKNPAKKSGFLSKYNKREKTFYSIIGVLGVLTVLFGFSMLDYFYLTPSKSSGKPVYGYRTENLPTLEESVLAEVEQFALTQDGVKEAYVSVKGPVIYIDVRVDNAVDVADARNAAEAVASKLESLVKLDDKQKLFDVYELQLVASNDDIDKLADENRKTELEYINEFDISVVKTVVEYAEEYPTQANIDRANNNLKYLGASSTKTELENRVNSLKALTAEEEAALGEIPALEVSKDIPPSEIATYPTWGNLNSATKTIEWK